MFEHITHPTLLLDKQKCLNNIERMVNKARSLSIPLRPHFKTHQSQQIGHWFRDFGIECIATSSVKMARYFAEDQWQDITIAFPLNIREINAVNELAAKVNLQVLIENTEGLQALKKGLSHPVSVFIKADTGYHRTGLSSGQFAVIDELIKGIKNAPKLSFSGFLSHAGHSYAARSEQEILDIHRDNVAEFQLFQERYSGAHPNLILSYGDTPSCSVAREFGAINELRPGNFVFYDLTQYYIGSCELENIAVAMACPVVAKHADRQEIVLYGGGIHFSKDRFTRPDGTTIFGLIVEMQDDQWQILRETSYLKSLSQEHGVVKASPRLFSKTQIGDLIFALPVHSCMTADIIKTYQTLDGEKITMMQ